MQIGINNYFLKKLNLKINDFIGTKDIVNSKLFFILMEK
jgi:hypothetical protein